MTQYARHHGRIAEGASLEDPTGDHMHTPCTSGGRDVDGPGEDVDVEFTATSLYIK